MTRAPAASYCISSLAEGVEVMLIGAGWECRGLWRWQSQRNAGARLRGAESSGAGKVAPWRKRVFWDTEERVPRQIAGLDRPKGWRPLKPFVRAQRLRCAEPAAARENGTAPCGRLGAAESQGAIEKRILTAFKVDRALPDRERDALKVRINWPTTGYEPGDYPPQINLRFKPSPADLSDYLVVMAWVARLDRMERRALLLRSLGLTFASMAERLNRSGTKVDNSGAKRLYWRAVRRVEDYAQGGPRPAGSRRGQGKRT